jgi:hypothetical protein
MSQIHVTVRLALLALATAASFTDAQQRSEDAILDTCRAAAGGSRARRNCEPPRATAPAQSETQIEIQRDAQLATDVVPLPTTPKCEATAAIEYHQRNTTARVGSTISAANCPAATTGKLTMVLRIRDAAGEIKPIEFSETWQRDDAQPVTSSTDYPIGENVELVSARVRGLSCTCGDPPPSPPEPATEPAAN